MSVLFLGGSMLGALGFGALLLPIGYLVCYATGVGNFRALPRSTQTLWSVAISTPVVVVLAVLLERIASVRTVGWGAVVVSLLGWAFALTRGRGPALPPAEAKYVRWGFVLATGLALYIMLAGLPIQIGDRLYDSQSTADLSVRVPLVDMATRHGMPVINPFNSIDGTHPPMRYYYYWYILCGVVARVFHLQPRAALTASGVWAALLLLSTGFLLLSSLFRPRTLPCSTRLLCLLTVPVGLITGLDILPVGGALLLHPPVLYPDPDYWRSVSDFSPSFNLALLYAPHHVAGIAISFLCFLLILPPHRVLLLAPNLRESKGHIADRAALAGMCLTMLVGTSTYMGMFAAIGGLFVLVERLRARDGRSAAVILGGAGIGLLLSLPFLYEVTHIQAHLQSGAQHQHMFHVSIHSWGMTKELVMSTYYRTHYMPHRAMEMLQRSAYWVLLGICEVGFLGVILWIRARRDWAGRHVLEPRRVYQWMLFFAIALPGFWLSSSSLAGANDLSRHAGVSLRFLGVMWAVPIVARYLLNRDWRGQVNHTFAGRLALVLVVLGFTTQAYQVVAQRFYSIYSVRLAIAHQGPYKQNADNAGYAHDVQQAFALLNRPDMPSGNILYDPMGEFWPMMNLYQTRYAVAGEKNCMTAFGGDIDRCHQAMPALLRLFGGGQEDAQAKIAQEPAGSPDLTLAAMTEACSRNAAAAVMATNTDKVWNYPESFVWKAPVLYSSSRVRVLRCPQVPSASITP